MNNRSGYQNSNRRHEFPLSMIKISYQRQLPKINYIRGQNSADLWRILWGKLYAEHAKKVIVVGRRAYTQRSEPDLAQLAMHCLLFLSVILTQFSPARKSGSLPIAFPARAGASSFIQYDSLSYVSVREAISPPRVDVSFFIQYDPLSSVSVREAISPPPPYLQLQSACKHATSLRFACVVPLHLQGQAGNKRRYEFHHSRLKLSQSFKWGICP
jgi:hypothetical protein